MLQHDENFRLREVLLQQTYVLYWIGPFLLTLGTALFLRILKKPLMKAGEKIKVTAILVRTIQQTTASIFKSRNHSISLEQLVEMVNLKKEQKSDHYVLVGRSRSFSTSELKKRSADRLIQHIFRLCRIALMSRVSAADIVFIS